MVLAPPKPKPVEECEICGSKFKERRWNLNDLYKYVMKVVRNKLSYRNYV